MLINPPPGLPQPQSEWVEPLWWVCSPDLRRRPGAPLPLVSWPESASDRVATTACENFGMAYAIACVSPDYVAWSLAIAAGFGFVAVSERATPPQTKLARAHDLPPLPQVPVGIFLRAGLARRRIMPVMQAVDCVLNPRHRAGA